MQEGDFTGMQGEDQQFFNGQNGNWILQKHIDNNWFNEVMKVHTLVLWIKTDVLGNLG